MATYLIETRHTKEQCLQDLDAVLAEAPRLLKEFAWGCGKGVHAGWALVEADDESAVRRSIPAQMADRTRVVEVGRFTPEQIRAFHSGA